MKDKNYCCYTFMYCCEAMLFTDAISTLSYHLQQEHFYTYLFLYFCGQHAIKIEAYNSQEDIIYNIACKHNLLAIDSVKDLPNLYQHVHTCLLNQHRLIIGLCFPITSNSIPSWFQTLTSLLLRLTRTLQLWIAYQLFVLFKQLLKVST